MTGFNLENLILEEDFKQAESWLKSTSIRAIRSAFLKNFAEYADITESRGYKVPFNLLSMALSNLIRRTFMLMNQTPVAAAARRKQISRANKKSSLVMLKVSGQIDRGSKHFTYLSWAQCQIIFLLRNGGGGEVKRPAMTILAACELLAEWMLILKLEHRPSTESEIDANHRITKRLKDKYKKWHPMQFPGFPSGVTFSSNKPVRDSAFVYKKRKSRKKRAVGPSLKSTLALLPSGLTDVTKTPPRDKVTPA